MQSPKSMKRIGLRELFNFREDLAKGRSCVLISAVCVSMLTWLSTGLFYTSFLSANGINIVEIGILSFIPFIANCFSIFTPSILERFRRRRWILAGSRLLYYTLNLLGVTVLPYFVEDPALKMYLFVVIVFAANIVNALFSGGYAVWHVNFIPDAVRAEYFSTKTLVTAVLGCGTSLAASIIADVLHGSAYEETIIVLLRIAAYLLGILDVVLLTLPKEFPYKQEKSKPRLGDIFIKPLKCRRFALTMLIIASYNFFLQIPQSSLNYYLLNDVGVEYTLISTVNMFYPIFLFLFLPIWKKILYRFGWFRTYALGELLHVPTTLLYSCISGKNYMWVLPTVRLAQHFFGVGRNVAYANLMYINLPQTDQTNYVSFHTLTLNIASFLGMMAGTGFVAAFPDLRISLLGMEFCNVQVLMWIEMFGQMLTPLMVMLLLPKLEPPAEI